MFKQNNSIKSGTGSIKICLWDYLGAFILVTGDITLTGDNNTHVSFAICVPFSTFNKKINNLFKRKDKTESIKSSLWDYFYAFSLVTGDITLTGDNNRDVAFTNCSPFSTCKTETDDLFKQNNSAKIEAESIKSSLWVSLDKLF